MKVLHLISGGDTGGAKTHIISLMKQLKKLMDAKVICFMKDTFYEDALKAGIDIQVFEQKKRTDLSIVEKLTKEILREEYDIIHCHGARANFIGMFLKKKISKPMITTIHSDYRLDFKDNLYKRFIFTPLNAIALRKFDYYVAISQDFKEMLEARGFDSKKIFIVYNGIDLDSQPDYVSKEDFFHRYNIDFKGKKIIGIMARLDAVKDHETFIKAAQKVLTKRKDVLFLIAGSGNEEDRLKTLANELGVGDRVHFLGYVRDPYSFYNAIDINVLTSISESFPYVILEGARFKKPIITTNVGGISHLVKDGYNGYLIKAKDSESLAYRIISLIGNEENIETMGRNLYQCVSDSFSSRNMAEKHKEIYEYIIEKFH
ncbi:MAG: glycosyltransferase family 4 protein [Tissierellia bacterium]|nr:glycosyltransferase family 4 protein [Tissierellia bacterium]